MAFASNGQARLLLSPPEDGLLTTRQVSLDAADRLVAPPEGLLTLGFDPTRFQTEPPACYRASWQLPGRDSHPLATTSLCWIIDLHIDLQLWAHPGEVASTLDPRRWSGRCSRTPGGSQGHTARPGERPWATIAVKLARVVGARLGYDPARRARRLIGLWGRRSGAASRQKR
jgi:hypothetical protein